MNYFRVDAGLRKEVTLDQNVVASIMVGNSEFQRMNLGEQLEFFEGFYQNQEEITHEKSRIFRGKLTRVEIYQRKSKKGNVLGEKAMVYFMATNEDGEEEEQSITTQWLNCVNPEMLGANKFDMDLANSLVEVARKNIGREVGIRKAYRKGKTKWGKSDIKHLADILTDSSGADNQDSGGNSLAGDVFSYINAKGGYTLDGDDKSRIREIAEMTLNNGDAAEQFRNYMLNITNGNEELIKIHAHGDDAEIIGESYIKSVFGG